MKYLKWVLIVVLVICLGLFLSIRDYEIARDPAWPEDIKAFVNPFTNRMRVVDATDNVTLFYCPASDSASRPATFQRDGDSVTVTFVKY